MAPYGVLNGMKIKIRKTHLGALALCSAAILAGCSSLQSESARAEKLVAERAQQRWDSILTGELDVAYGLLSPAQRTSVTPLAYKRKVLNSPFRWKSAEVSQVQCQELTCQATVRVAMDVIGAVPGVARFPIEQDMEEQWILTDGEWWFVSN